MKTYLFAIFSAAVLLAAVLSAQTSDIPHREGAALIDYAVPYGSSNCFNRILPSAGTAYVSGTLAHLQRFGAYEVVTSDYACDVFFEAATSVASGTGNHLPSGSKLVWRFPEKYIAVYCYGATRFNVCPARRDVP